MLEDKSERVNASKYVGLCQPTFISQLKLVFHTFTFLRGVFWKKMINKIVCFAIAENKQVCILY
ncbi:hypothetical protein COK00_21730 [Bacillus cereus]|nr:hypothetical protein CON28_00185 [Bacillus cereus]PEX40058.1 hypothetical protein CN455_04520 [Bacillus cereus]PFB16549.1 hypothetical protein CN399_10985 [Bacillus cereus]PFP60623.1 hypothetical protein COK00_21730 [Bacillus cereus]PFV60202.1 hypothetical protein COL09_09595 [Bacillus cereus]